MLKDSPKAPSGAANAPLDDADISRLHAGDAAYTPMAPGYDGIAFKAACDLIFEGGVQPAGYTEPLLHKARLNLKGYQGN